MTQPDTIAAIATPAGAGGIGIVRISGSHAPTIASAIVGAALPPRIFHFSTFTEASGGVLDRGLAVFFPAPRSFTGEDVVELHVHGSPVVLDLLLRRVCELGARRARAGEFSERAFLNGKIDLVQAEAVADLIAAGSEAAARAALRSLEGDFSKQVEQLRDALVRLRAWLEASLDFPEEEIDFLSAPELAAALADVRSRGMELVSSARRGVLLRNGLHVVIIGRPNTGKSSLLNALAQSERAIVTPIPGTTRDVLRENVNLDGIAITLADTAGLRESEDVVEQEGMRRANAELANADVTLLVTDSANSESDRALLHAASVGSACVIVHNKIDVSGEAASKNTIDGTTHIHVSATRGDGLDLLRTELTRLAGHGDGTQGAFSARSRHVQALEAMLGHLDSATAELGFRRGELAAEELRQAQQKLGEITGEFRSDDLLSEIFSSFCIGK